MSISFLYHREHRLGSGRPLRILGLLLLLCGGALLSAQTYYVSPSGNDGNPGTRTRPWRNIDKVNQNLADGVTVKFERDEVYYGNLNINGHDDVTIEAYGNGKKPRLQATKSIVGKNAWFNEGGNVWSASVTGVNKIRMFFRGTGTARDLGREPDVNQGNKGYYYYESVSEGDCTFAGSPRVSVARSITDNQLSKDFTDAELMVRLNRFRLFVRESFSQSSNKKTINFGCSDVFSPVINSGYFFQNGISTLDQNGEWAHPSPNGRIYLRSTSNPAGGSGTIVHRYANKSATILVRNADDVTIRNVRLEGANLGTLTARDSRRLEVNNVEIVDAGFHGILLTNADNALIRNSLLARTMASGIKIDAQSSQATVRDTRLRDIAMVAGRGEPDGRGYAGISVRGPSSLLERNDIKNTGSSGIDFEANSGNIRRNMINEVCFVRDDAAGIYINNDAGAGTVNCDENIVRNAVNNGADIGTNKVGQTEIAMGIYLDIRTENVNVRRNSIDNCKDGIYLHVVRNCLIDDNLVVNCRDSGLRLKDDQPNAGTMFGLTVKHNKFAGTSTPLVKLESRVNNPTTQWWTVINAFGSFERNIFINPRPNTAGKLAQIVWLWPHNNNNRNPNSFGQVTQNTSIADVQTQASNWTSGNVRRRLTINNYTKSEDQRYFLNWTSSAANNSLPSNSTWRNVADQPVSGTVSIPAWRSGVFYRSSTNRYSAARGVPGQSDQLNAEQVGGEITTYPNPLNGEKLRLDGWRTASDQVIRADVFSATGQLLTSRKEVGVPSMRIDLEGIGTQLLFVHIRVGGRPAVVRRIVRL